MKPYRPSNGSEGEGFIENFCARCIHEKFHHTQNDNDKKCDIFSRALVYNYDEKEFPKEWQYDENGKPTCIAHQRWDWGYDDEGGLNEPPPPEPYDPNQLCFPFVTEILEHETNEITLRNLGAVPAQT